jgi:hypothetical protein
MICICASPQLLTLGAQPTGLCSRGRRLRTRWPPFAWLQPSAESLGVNGFSIWRNANSVDAHCRHAEGVRVSRLSHRLAIQLALQRHTKRKGRESNPPRLSSSTANGFEDRGGHRTPSSSEDIVAQEGTSGKRLLHPGPDPKRKAAVWRSLLPPPVLLDRTSRKVRWPRITNLPTVR